MPHILSCKPNTLKEKYTSLLHLTEHNEKIQTDLDFKGPTGRVRFELIIIMVMRVGLGKPVCRYIWQRKREQSRHHLLTNQLASRAWNNLELRLFFEGDLELRFNSAHFFFYRTLFILYSDIILLSLNYWNYHISNTSIT